MHTCIYRAVVDTTIEATHPDPRKPAPRRRPVYQWTASLAQQSQTNPPKTNAPKPENTAVTNNQTYKAQGKGHNYDHASSSFSSSASAAGGWFSKTLSSKHIMHTLTYIFN